MAITTMDGLVAALAGATQADTYEASITAKAAGDFCSLWTAGGRPGAGATPASGAGVAPTSATAGAIAYTNPGGANTGYLARLYAAGSTIGSLILVDRLVHTAGLSGALATSQTVSSAAITRSYNSGIDVGLWIEVYSALGATGATATVTYTNQSGTASRSGTAVIPASAGVGFSVPVTLQSGDTGVQSVQSVILSISTGTAGSFGVTLTQRLATIPIVVVNTGVVLDYAGLGLPVIQNSPCLSWYVLASTTNTGTIITELTFAQG